MPYTTEDGGRLNNFAREPKMYQAEEPSKNEKRNYVIFGAIAFLFLSGIVAVAVYASGAS